jgi:very-short-patch-repair endonuclease
MSRRRSTPGGSVEARCCRRYEPSWHSCEQLVGARGNSPVGDQATWASSRLGTSSRMDGRGPSGLGRPLAMSGRVCTLGYVSLDVARTERAIVQRLARDQWVRLHGTPRVTVLAGGDRARRIWAEWVAMTGTTGRIHDGSAELESALRAALREAVAEPAVPVAVIASRAALTGWRQGRGDRDAAMVDEGWLEVPDGQDDERGAGRVAAPRLDARSAAEATLYEALEATSATRGRFELNGSLSVRFGARAAEVDLLGRLDRIAIEIDGYHHFTDLEAYRRDRRKDLLLQTHGFVVIRLLAEDVVRAPREAVTTVLRGIAMRRGDHA